MNAVGLRIFLQTWCIIFLTMVHKSCIKHDRHFGSDIDINARKATFKPLFLWIYAKNSCKEDLKN